MCSECVAEVELRKLAVRLLTAPGPYQDDEVLVDSQNGGDRDAKQDRIAEFVERLRAGEIEVPAALPCRVSPGFSPSNELQAGIYRALGNGSRRKAEHNIGRW
jgi:hypothetical protein